MSEWSPAKAQRRKENGRKSTLRLGVFAGAKLKLETAFRRNVYVL